MASGSGIRTGWILASGVVGAILFVATVVWLDSFFTVSKNREVYRKVLSLDNPTLRDLRAQEEAVLNSYGWVDPEKKVARIPIERAMELLAQEAREARRGE
jgi:hypothetical protein